LSNRTIIEINHDFAHVINGERFEFCNALIEVLRSSSSEDGWAALERLGVRHIATGHHSEDLAEKARQATGNRHR
jgi:hypothetical protein